MNVSQETVLSLWHGHIPKNRTLTGRIGRTLKRIVEDVAYENDLSVKDLVGAGRHRSVSSVRQEVMWRAYEERTSDGRRVYSLPQIGAYLGGRDHTTVLHGIRQHEKRMKARAAA